MGFFSKLFSDEAQAAAPGVQAAPAKTQALNNDELIAVISAAIAAFEGSYAASNLIIRKINRAQGQVTVWNNAGRADCMRSRRI